MQYKQILLESNVKYNEHYLNRYFRFIDYYLKNPPDNIECTHHILPKSKDCWPKYSSLSKNKWNGVGLTNRQHYIAHMLLWKAIPSKKGIVYAANMLSHFYGNSKTYSELRSSFSESISIANKGKKHSKEFGELVSERVKNTVLVYNINDPDQNIFRVSVFDEKYKSGEYVFYRTGRLYDETVKNKISESRTGMKWATNGETHIMCRKNELPEGYYFGYNFEVDREHIKETVWAYNEETGEQKRIHKEKVPKGWVVGRTDNGWAKGLEKANQMTTIVDFSERKCKKVFDFDKSVCGPESGTNTEKTYIFIYDNKIFTCFKKVFEFAKKRGIILNSDLEKVVPNPHHNNTKESFEFRKKYCGKTYLELGLRKYKLTDFPLSEMEKKEIYWNE